MDWLPRASFGNISNNVGYAIPRCFSCSVLVPFMSFLQEVGIELKDIIFPEKRKSVPKIRALEKSCYNCLASAVFPESWGKDVSESCGGPRCPTGGGRGGGECLWPLVHRVGTRCKSVVFVSLETQTSYFSTHLFISRRKKWPSPFYKMLFYKILNGRKIYTWTVWKRSSKMLDKVRIFF